MKMINAALIGVLVNTLYEVDGLNLRPIHSLNDPRPSGRSSWRGQGHALSDPSSSADSSTEEQEYAKKKQKFDKLKGMKNRGMLTEEEFDADIERFGLEEFVVSSVVAQEAAPLDTPFPPVAPTATPADFAPLDGMPETQPTDMPMPPPVAPSHGTEVEEMETEPYNLPLELEESVMREYINPINDITQVKKMHDMLITNSGDLTYQQYKEILLSILAKRMISSKTGLDQAHIEEMFNQFRQMNRNPRGVALQSIQSGTGLTQNTLRKALENPDGIAAELGPGGLEIGGMSLMMGDLSEMKMIPIDLADMSGFLLGLTEYGLEGAVEKFKVLQENRENKKVNAYYNIIRNLKYCTYLTYMQSRVDKDALKGWVRKAMGSEQDATAQAILTIPDLVYPNHWVKILPDWFSNMARREANTTNPGDDSGLLGQLLGTSTHDIRTIAGNDNVVHFQNRLFDILKEKVIESTMDSFLMVTPNWFQLDNIPMRSAMLNSYSLRPTASTSTATSTSSIPWKSDKVAIVESSGEMGKIQVISRSPINLRLILNINKNKNNIRDIKQLIINKYVEEGVEEFVFDLYDNNSFPAKKITDENTSLEGLSSLEVKKQ